jgi:glyceraldehyde 3-phosphate dehydrogenase
VCTLEKATTPDAVNVAMKAAAEGPMKGILQYCTEELVSVDFRGNPYSSILDASYTKMVGEKMVHILSWYDNEWGYSCRVRDLIKFMGTRR